MTATTPRSNPDIFHRIRFQQIYLPPRTSFFISFSASFTLVISTFVAIIGVRCLSAFCSSGLVGRFSVCYVDTWREIIDISVDKMYVTLVILQQWNHNYHKRNLPILVGIFLSILDQVAEIGLSIKIFLWINTWT